MDKARQEFIIKFGQNLKRIRQQKKITQVELAIDSNMEVSQISRIERGVQNTTISTAYLIAEAMGIDVYELFKFE